MSDEPKFPLNGMTLVPEFYGSESWCVLGIAWAGLLEYLLCKDEARAQFQADTGLNIDSLKKRTGLERAIDQATGYEAKVMAAWCDWVTKNYWGVAVEESSKN